MGPRARSIPANAVVYQRTGEFSESTIPPALRSSHTTKPGVWARIRVVRGRIRYRILEPALEEQLLSPDEPGIVEPGIRHEVEPVGEVRFYVEFLRAPRQPAGPPTLETPRLRLRAPRAQDVDALFEIQGDRDAMRHTYAAPDREATAAFLDAYAARFAEDGFAPWVAVLREDDRIVGWGGLNRDPEQPHWGIEVAYFIHRAHWGRGLAGELIRASLSLAFDELGLPEVIAFTRPANHASSRVLVKAGFVHRDHVAELERDRYVVTRERWKATRGTAS